MCRGATTGGPSSVKDPTQKKGERSRDGGPTSDGSLLVGHVIKPHGLRGDLKARLCGHDAQTLSSVTRVVLVWESRRRVFRVRKLVERAKDILLCLEGIDTREKGESLRGAEVRVSRDDLPPLQSDEFYLADALGAVVVEEGGDALGELVRIEENPAGPLLVIRKGREELLLPAKLPFLRDWDEETNRLFVWVPEGMPRDRTKA